MARKKRFALQLEIIDWMMVAAIFGICLAGALLIDIHQCPDEAGRKLISDWIWQHKALPAGTEEGVMMDGWGFSYALRPYLSSIIGACCMGVVCQVTAHPNVLLAASRICSVLSIAAVCYFCLKIGRLVFRNKWSGRLMAGMVCFLPQVVFLGCYQNNDALSLAAVCCMIYFLIVGERQHWSVRACVGLAAGIALCLLSYYNAYIWILMSVVFCIMSCLRDQTIQRKAALIANRALLVAGIVLVLAGWHFIRNAVLLDGDFLGFATEGLSRQRAIEQGKELYQYQNFYAAGASLQDFFEHGDGFFVRATMESFVGVFGYMTIYLPGPLYGLYLAVFALGLITYALVGVFRRKSPLDKGLALVMTCSGITTVVLHIVHSYLRDYQPQGRYIISLAIILAWMTAYGMDHVSITVDEDGGDRRLQGRRINPAMLLLAVWMVLFVCAATGTMSQMI